MRKSKLTPAMFLDTILFKEIDNSSVSLEDHCITLKQRYDVDIKKQSLDERFDVTAVKFIQELFDRQLSNQINSAVEKAKLGDVLQRFSAVLIKDSTRFQISEALKEYYPGSTGAASGAGVHIQFEFDMLNGNVNDLTVSDALRQDATDAQQTMKAIKRGQLIIRDLGYYSTNVFEHIHEKKAYYISRTKITQNFIDEKTGKKIDFNAIQRKMKRNKLTHMEVPVAIGKKKLPARLIIEILPDEEVQKRLKKVRREAQRKGTTLSDDYESRARLNLFITNVPSAWITTAEIRTIYLIRWQIELRFKAWKSFYHLDAVKKMQRYRFECYLYSTLLLLMINQEIATNFFAILWKHTGKPLSFLKFYKTTSQNIQGLRKAIMGAGNSLLQYLELLYEISYEKLFVEKRKNHSGGLEEILNRSLV